MIIEKMVLLYNGWEEYSHSEVQHEDLESAARGHKAWGKCAGWTWLSDALWKITIHSMVTLKSSDEF